MRQVVKSSYYHHLVSILISDLLNHSRVDRCERREFSSLSISIGSNGVAMKNRFPTSAAIIAIKLGMPARRRIFTSSGTADRTYRDSQIPKYSAKVKQLSRKCEKFSIIKNFQFQ